MKLVCIPKDKYDNYRLDVIFKCNKWDPQFLDSNTIAKHILVLTEKEHKDLVRLTESIDKETIQAEQFLYHNFKIAKMLKLPKEIEKQLKKMKNYQADNHIRLMRYDFHPTIEGNWAISEVNSDVPGGFAEASLMPQIAIDLCKEKKYKYINFGHILTDAIAKKVKSNGNIMLIHCTCYSDDRQVMQFLGDKLKTMGFNPIYGAVDHIRFKNNKAISILDGNQGNIDAIIKYTPIEWMKDIKPKHWHGYFHTVTPSCNHPIAMYVQTKRFPFVWDILEENGLRLSTWRQLLPETIKVKDVKNRKGFIYKPACGRVGENISIKEACRDDEFKRILKDVKRKPKKYIAQKQFNSMPLVGENGENYHVCLGCYSVEGQAAGYYARISTTPRIDSHAEDIPVVIEKG